MIPPTFVAAAVVVVTGQDLPKTPAGWVAALESISQDTREQARHALGSDGPFGAAAVAAMIEGLAGPDGPGRWRIPSILADHGAAAAPALIRAMRRPEPAVREGAARALGTIYPRPPEAAPVLAEAAKDPNPEVRAAAVASLGRMRRSADKVVPALIGALRDPDEDVRFAAADALGNLGPKAGPAVGALVAAMKDREWPVRHFAVEALSRIGPDAKDAVPALVDALRAWPKEAPRRSLGAALAMIGPPAKAAVPALIDSLRSEDAESRDWFFGALGRIGPDAAAAVPDLLKLASNKETPQQDRWQAITALGCIGPPAKSAVPFLIAELSNRESDVEPELVIAALGGIGPDAAPAVAPLVALVRDRSVDEGIRKVAAEAVGKIDPALAAREKLADAALDVRLGAIPVVALKPRPPVTVERTKRIKGLIAKLADTGKPGLGLSGSASGRAFAPLPDRDQWQGGLLFSGKPETSDALRDLVALGPTALPFLLDSLGDATPTKLKVRRMPGGMMFVGGSAAAKPFHPREAAFDREPPDDPDDDTGGIESYTVTVGDACFVALGQIVGRDYRAVQYIPSGIVGVNSPVVRAGFRDQLRAAWGGPDSARVLLDSLLVDYATEGVFNGRSLDGWGEGSDSQIEATVRLLYYFPEEAAPLVAARLKALDVRDPGRNGWMDREVRNRVRTADFIKAAAWCQAPEVRTALADVSRRTDDPEIKKVLSPPAP